MHRVQQEAEASNENMTGDTRNKEELASEDKTSKRPEQPPNNTPEAPNRLRNEDEGGSDESEEDTSSSQLENNIPRVKKPIWKAQEGFGRCGKGCDGCAMKCAEQHLPNCQNCHLNMEKNTSTYGCHNRKECLEPKPKLVKGSTDKSSTQKKPLLRNLSTTRIDKSVSPMVQEKILHFSAKSEDEEKRKRESERSPGNTPPGKERKETRIPGLHNSKKLKEKGKTPASKHASF